MRTNLWDRRELVGGAAGLALMGSGLGRATAASVPPESVSDPVLSAILSAGNWSTSADDDGGNERIPEVAADAWVKGASSPSASRQSIVDLGALVLTLAVAEWGIEWTNASPPDPANTRWTGPRSIEAGKHLMSYALGGIGLPHLDAQDGVAFFEHLAGVIPPDDRLNEYLRNTATDFHYDRVRAAGGMCDGQHAVIGTDLFGEPFRHGAVYYSGSRYCARFNPAHRHQADQWQALRSWTRLGLRRRDMQRWIVDTWINRYWLRAHDLVMTHPHGSLCEAFVLARIWNSGEGLAAAAMHAADSSSEPKRRIQIELQSYGSRSPTYKARLAVMQRPAVAYHHLAMLN